MKTTIIIILVIVVVIVLLLLTKKGQEIINKNNSDEDMDFDESEKYIKSYTLKDISIIKKGNNATPEEEEEMLRALINNAYIQLTILKNPYKKITDKSIKENALKNGRTYKEELAVEIIKDITKNTRPFGNIEGNSISTNIMNKYITPARNTKLCRPGMNIDSMISNGSYKHFTKTTGKCKVNEFIETI